jgi:hypothetical protein
MLEVLCTMKFEKSESLRIDTIVYSCPNERPSDIPERRSRALSDGGVYQIAETLGGFEILGESR